jgi:hypothetical protein
VEVGNFAPVVRSYGDSVKARAFADFFRDMKYDAVTLSSRETMFGMDVWTSAWKSGCPLIAANLFSDQKGKKPFFEGKQDGGRKTNGQFVIREDHGEKLAVIGFIGEAAWKARHDTTGTMSWRSPFMMGDLIRKIAKKSDYLTVIGEFSQGEADSLAKLYPQIKTIVSSAIRSDQVLKKGSTLVTGVTSRGNFGNWVQWNWALPDTGVNYVSRTQPLDESVPEDSTVLKFVSDAKARLAPQTVTVTSSNPPTPAVPKPAPRPAPSAPTAPQQAAQKPAPVSEPEPVPVLPDSHQ